MEQIIRMIVKQVMRRVINIGINKGLGTVGKKMKPKKQRDDQPPIR